MFTSNEHSIQKQAQVDFTRSGWRQFAKLNRRLGARFIRGFVLRYELGTYLTAYETAGMELDESCQEVRYDHGVYVLLRRMRGVWYMMAGKAANPVPTLAQGQTKGRTRDHLSEAAGVSHGTFAKAKKLVQSADEETKRELRAGKVTVNRAYTELLEKEHEGETKICERCKQEKPLSAFSIPSNRRSFSSVCRDCEKEISAVAKSAAEAAAKPADIAASSEPPCPIPGMVMYNGAPIHVERPLPDTPEMFRYVADLVKSCCDSYVIGLTSAMRRYSSGMGSEEHNAQILEMVRRTNEQVLTILNERMEEK